MALEESASAQFEKFVADLLMRMNCKDIVTNITYKNHEIDILFGEKENTTVVEIKRYRYFSPPGPDLFSRALYKIHVAQRLTMAKNSILVMSCPLTQGMAAVASKHPRVDIWDAQKLFEKTLPFPDLLKRLETLLEVRFSDTLQVSPETEANDRQTVELSKGEELARALSETRPGREDAYAFEDKCTEALKYLFDQDLFGWHKQNETEDGLHRRDLVCRILPNSEVWKLILTDLKSRYVIFEFKNYSKPISQHEVVTTERYLYPSALRKLAIIISPHGCSPSAMRVINGAMREHGKLILPLKVSELSKLLIEKDRGSDPNVFLFDQVDSFLMSLGR